MAVTLSSPYADPSYLAFLRAQGMSESEAVGEAQRRIATLRRGLTMRLPDYAEQEKRGQEQIGNSYEDNGLFRSGARLVAQQRLSNDVAGQKLGDVANTQDSIAEAQAQQAQAVAEIRRRTAEQELATRGGYSG